MAGFLGGSSGSGGGGEIQFPAEFIDPVTKLRVSEPETLIDTDFEYGLQPTKWETVELINNTPSFFSKSGDTTINGILAMVTTATSREIKVTTQDNHGLAVGIPINVSGTKSITADGSYIINSIPDPKTFTYLAKQNQDFTASIFDLYTSIITGEFFQGSQIKISDSQGIVTNAAAPSVLTVQTDSPHGFQVGTPFYFLNLNSTVSQQFDASNTGAKTFDSSNSATAQTFDGSNTLTSYALDFTNKALINGATSATQTHSTANKTILVLHGSETFLNRKIGTPLYYNVVAASGYFNTFPRGIVYLVDNGFNSLGASTSTFSVSSTPGGTALDIPSYPNGTFQLANNAALFAGNNNEINGQVVLGVSESGASTFDGTNTSGSLSTVNTYSGSIIQLNNDAGTTISSGLNVRSMVFYTTTGTAASGLTNNTTYWVTFYNEPAGASVPGFFQIKVAATPTGPEISISGGTGTQKFRQIGVSVDKDIFHIPLHGFSNGDLVKYSYPVGGAIGMTSRVSDYVYIGTVFDTHNFNLELTPALSASGGTITQVGSFKVHTFLDSGNFTVASGQGTAEVLIVAGGGAGGGRHGGGGGAGGMVEVTNIPIAAGTYPIVVGNGAPVNSAYTPSPTRGATGSPSSAFGNTAFGGGGGGTYSDSGNQDASGGGSAGGFGYAADGVATATRGTITVGTGTAYGTNSSARGAGGVTGTGGGGAGNNTNQNAGGSGRQNNIDGNNYFYAGGGGGSSWGNSGGTNFNMRGGIGGGGGGGSAAENWDTNLLTGGGSARNAGGNGLTGSNGGSGAGNGGPGTGGNGGANTGGGGGGSGQNGGFPSYNGWGGGGGKGIVIVRYVG